MPRSKNSRVRAALVTEARQSRHCYLTLAGPQVAGAVEAMFALFELHHRTPRSIGEIPSSGFDISSLTVVLAQAMVTGHAIQSHHCAALAKDPTLSPIQDSTPEPGTALIDHQTVDIACRFRIVAPDQPVIPDHSDSRQQPIVRTDDEQLARDDLRCELLNTDLPRVPLLNSPRSHPPRDSVAHLHQDRGI